MAGMHALHKILANVARPQRQSVTPGEFLEIEPDIFGVILGVNGVEATRMSADLAELGITKLPIGERIVAVSDHASPAPTPDRRCAIDAPYECFVVFMNIAG